MSCLWKEQPRASRASGRHRAMRCVQGGTPADFWAAWCGPCRMAAPEVKKVATEMAKRAIVLKVDTERWPALAQRYNVMSIPNFVVLKNGEVVLQQPGLADHKQMVSWLKKAA